MKLTGLQIVYGLTAITGLIVTWYFNLQPRETNFIYDLYTNSASASISNDLFVVVFTFLLWSFIETRRLKMSYWWAYSILTIVIAAACAVPLFMLMRERRLLAIAETEK